VLEVVLRGMEADMIYSEFRKVRGQVRMCCGAAVRAIPKRDCIPGSLGATSSFFTLDIRRQLFELSIPSLPFIWTYKSLRPVSCTLILRVLHCATLKQAMEDFSIGIIGLGDMGRMYLSRFRQAGWR
jgi:hypothetical protein